MDYLSEGRIQTIKMWKWVGGRTKARGTPLEKRLINNQGNGPTREKVGNREQNEGGQSKEGNVEFRALC